MGYQEKIRLTIIALVLATCSYGQEVVEVKGFVADSATLKPISWVNVIIKHTSHGTTTNNNGYFTLSANRSDTILFSFIGYRTLEFPVVDWEPSVILLADYATILNAITIHGAPLEDSYLHLFDEENIKLQNSKKPLPFYYPKGKKDRILLGRAKAEGLRVKRYVDLVIKDEKMKNDLIRRHRLTEKEYYDLLTRFNEKNYTFMYYLTDSELLSLLYRFFEGNAPR